MNDESAKQTADLQQSVERLRAGDLSARDDLIRLAGVRLLNLTRHMKKGYDRVGRWEQTEDIFQQAMLRLYKSLEKVELQDATHFLRLGAQQIRRQLIDLSRSYYGPEGMGSNHKTQGVEAQNIGGNGAPLAFDAAEVSQDPQRLQEWSEFHQLIDGLPEEEKAVVDLLWYHGMTQEAAADLLNTSVQTVKRRWRSARIALHEKLDGQRPGID